MSVKKKYERIDHPADEGFRAYGEDLAEAFENAALALNDIIVDVDRVRPEKKFDIRVESEDREALLYDWLDQLLYLHDAEGFVFSEFDVEELRESEGVFLLEAVVGGEKYDRKRHGHGSGVKAITYHMMEIEEDETCSVQVVVDV